MPNKLLSTVFAINEEIEQLKSGYSTILEALEHNPSIGATRVSQVETFLDLSRGGFGSIKDRFDFIEKESNDLVSKIDQLTVNDIEPVKALVKEAKGDFKSLKESIENSKLNVKVNFNDAEATITIDNETAVDSRIVDVAAGGVKTITSSNDGKMYDVLVEDTMQNKAIVYNVKDSISGNDSIVTIKNSNDYVALKSTDKPIMYDFTGGVYYKEKMYEEYSSPDRFIVIGNRPSATNLNLKNAITPAANKDLTKEYYKIPRDAIYILSGISVSFFTRQYVSFVRVYPYTPENTVNYVNIVASLDGKVVGTNIPGVPNQPGTNPSNYIDYPINTVIDSMVVGFNSTNVTGYNYLNTVEIYRPELIANSTLYSIDERPILLTDIKNANYLSAESNIKRHFGDIFCGISNDRKTYALKPSLYDISVQDFTDLNGNPVEADTIKNYRMSSILAWGAGRCKDTLNIAESWTCIRDISADSWCDGGNDCFDGYGAIRLTVNGLTQAMNMIPGEYNYLIGGYDVRSIVTFPAKNLWRMEMTSTSAYSVTFQSLTAGGNTGSDGGGGRYEKVFYYNGSPIKYYRNWGNNSGEAHSIQCVIPLDINGSNNTSYSSNGDSMWMSLSNQRIPVVYYIYVGFASDAQFEAAIKEDLNYRIVSCTNDLRGLNDRTVQLLENERVYTSTICTKGWNKDIFFSGTVQDGINIKYALSFDKGYTWFINRSNIWQNISIGEIYTVGMNNIELINIDRTSMAEKLSDYLTIAVMATDRDASFSKLSIDTGEDLLVEVTDSDLIYCKSNRLQNLLSKSISFSNAVTKLYNNIESLNIGFKCLISTYRKSCISPELKSLSINIGVRKFFRNFNSNEADDVSVRYFDNYIELENKSIKDMRFNINTICPNKSVIFDKGSGINIQEMNDLTDKYSKTKDFLEIVKDRVVNDITTETYITEGNSIGIASMLANLIIKSDEVFNSKYMTVDGLKTSIMTIGIGTNATYTTGKYTVSPNGVNATFTTPVLLLPNEDIASIYVQNYCDLKPKSVTLIINDNFMVPVNNNRITLGEIRNNYKEPVKNIKVKFEYNSSTSNYEFTGYSVRFQCTKRVVSNNKVCIEVKYDNQTAFTIPFTKELESYIIVSIGGIRQIKDVDYTLDFTKEIPELKWISSDFSLDVSDEIVVELII